jgi:MFS family permease
VRLHVYRHILGRPQAARLVVASILGRLPVGMMSLTNVLLVQQSTGSFGLAGLVSGAYALAAAMVAPLLGRQVDRVGQPRVLVHTAIGNAIGLLALLVAAVEHLPFPALVLAAACAGASRPPLSACMRALWPALVDSASDVAAAYALESVMVEVFSIGGPLLTVAVVTVTSPGGALVLAVLLSLAGVFGLVSSPMTRRWRAGARPPDRAVILRSPGMRTVLVTNASASVAFGTLAVTMPAFASLSGRPAAGGVALAALAFGSMLSGLWYGSRRWNGPLRTRYLLVAALFALGLAPLPLAPSLPGMVVLAGLAGLALAPATACVYLVVDRLAPAGTRTEAFTWVISSTAAGSSLGSAVAGGAVGLWGVRQGVLTAFVFAAAGVLFAFVRRSTISVDEPGPA